MKYARIAWAAIQRHRIERPIRDMWFDYISDRSPAKQRKLGAKGFAAVVDTLESKGYIVTTEASLIKREYARYSETLHGSRP
jgi:hypothetical protein